SGTPPPTRCVPTPPPPRRPRSQCCTTSAWSSMALRTRCAPARMRTCALSWLESRREGRCAHCPAATRLSLPADSALHFLLAMQPQVAAALAAGGTVLASHPRLARALAAEFDRHQREAGQQAWPRPAIWTLDQWLEQCWTAEGDRLLLSGAQEARLWESIIASGGHGRRMLHPGAAAAEAARAWRLAHDWELDWSSPAWNDTEDAQAFAVWAGEFRRHCRAEQWITAAELAGAAAGFAPPQGPVALAGFEERAPAQARRFAAWRNSGVAVSEFGPPHPPAAPALVMASDADDEFNRAARWARGLMEQGARGPIGVVVPDLGPVRAAAERSFTAALHPDRAPWSHAPRGFHLSLGVPLAFAPPVVAVLELLRAWEAPGPIPLPEVLAWLRSPYTAGAEVEAAARARLERILRRQGRMRWSWRDLQTQARAGGAPAWATAVGAGRVARAAWPARQSYQAWADAVAELARATGWPGDRSLGSEEQQAAQAWEALLLEFAQLDEVARRPIAFSEARSRIAGLAQRIFQPQAADAAVQILGWHDAVGAEFQHLWIAGSRRTASVFAAGAATRCRHAAGQRSFGGRAGPAAVGPNAGERAVGVRKLRRRQRSRTAAPQPLSFRPGRGGACRIHACGGARRGSCRGARNSRRRASARRQRRGTDRLGANSRGAGGLSVPGLRASAAACPPRRPPRR